MSSAARKRSTKRGAGGGWAARLLFAELRFYQRLAWHSEVFQLQPLAGCPAVELKAESPSSKGDGRVKMLNLRSN